MVQLILVIWKPILILLGACILLTVGLIWISMIIGIVCTFPFTDYFFPDTPLATIITFANFFFIATLPLLYLGIRIAGLMLNNRLHLKWHYGLNIFWLFNVICFFSVGSYLGQQFRDDFELVDNQPIAPFQGDTLFIEIPNPRQHSGPIQLDKISFHEDYILSKMVKVNIVNSNDFNLNIVKNARGYSIAESKSLAENINYSISQEGNTISIPADFIVEKGNKWRAQHINIELQVPEGKHIVINKHKERHLFRKHDLRKGGVLSSIGNKIIKKTDKRGKTQFKNELDFKDFSKISLNGQMKVFVNHSDEFSVRLGGRKSYLDKVKINQDQDQLFLSHNLKHTQSPIKAYITLPQLDMINAENTDDIKISGFTGSKMNISNNGKYDIRANINIDSLYLSSIGKNEIDVRGKGKFLKAELGNNTKLDAEHFSVQYADLIASDNVSAKVEVSDTLVNNNKDIRLSIVGDPVVISN